MKKGIELTYSSSEGPSKLYDFVMGIMSVVEESGKSTTVKINGKNVTITPAMVSAGTQKVVQVVKSH